MTNIEKRKKRQTSKMKKKLFFKKIVFLLILVTGLLFVSNQFGVFNVKSIRVEGASTVDSEEIIRRSGLVVDSNYFEFSEKSRVEDISSIPMIKNSDIRFSPFGDTIINIEERVPVMKLRNYSDYFLFDSELRCVDIVESEPENLIHLSGIDIDTVELGNFLFSVKENPDKNKTLTEILKDEKIALDILKITIEEDKVSFSTKDDIEVDYGSYSNDEYKLTLLSEILKDIHTTNKNIAKIEMERGNNPVVTMRNDYKGDTSVSKSKEKSSNKEENNKKIDKEKDKKKDKKSNKESLNNKSKKINKNNKEKNTNNKK